MSNNLAVNPAYIDTDTTYASGTNWRGANGGSQYTGKLGIRPIQIIVTPLGATTAGQIVINEVNSSSGGTGPVLFETRVSTALSTQALSQQFTIQLTASGWHDFIVTGPSATNTAVQIYYRV